jgi:ABC-type spermidine/putrescine transport system permease subunit II
VRGVLRGWAVAVYAFLWVPVLVVVVHSFNDGPRLAVWHGAGVRWYGVALHNAAVVGALRTTAVVAGLCALVAVLVGGLAGVALARQRGPLARVLLGLVLLVLVTPEVVDGIAYLILFVRVDLDDGLVRLVLGHAVYASALVALVVRARLAGVDAVLEEAAADLGAPPLRAFLTVTLPLLAPAALAGGLLAFTSSLDDVVIAAFVARPGGTTLPLYVFSSVRTGLRGDLAAVSTLSLAATLVALGVVVRILWREKLDAVLG